LGVCLFNYLLSGRAVAWGDHSSSYWRALCDSRGCLTRTEPGHEVMATDIVHLSDSGATYLVRAVAEELLRPFLRPLVSRRTVADKAHAVGAVEDDDDVAALTVEMINQLGYDTTRVASAEAALGALADRRSVDIVFSDIMMPGRMNGVELAQEIRRRRPDMPVLLTSGYAEGVRRNAAAQQIKIIPKPYRIDELRDALAAVRQDARESLREH